MFSAESIASWKEQYDYVEDKYYLTIPDLSVCIGGMGGKKIPKGEDRLVIVFARSEIEYYKMFVQV